MARSLQPSQRMTQQVTIARKVEILGVGLHSGKAVRLEIQPAKQNSGIVFKRADLMSAPLISALHRNVVPGDLCTVIGTDEVNRVSTIEHLMAALFVMGIDNCVIKVDGPEIPILDGSSAPFIKAIASVGVEKQNAYKKFLVLKKPFEVAQDGKLLRAKPSEKLTIHAEVEYKSRVIGFQEYKTGANFDEVRHIMDARTFCHIQDVDAMRRAGLALGGSLENAIVVTDANVLNPEGLRYPDEFVRHKILDLIGDLYLLGAPLVASVFARKTGHSFHADFVGKLWNQREHYLSTVEGLNIIQVPSESSRLKLAYLSRNHV